MSTTTTIAPTDVFGIVHDFTRTNPVPPKTTLGVEFQHFVWEGRPMPSARIHVHGGPPEFLAALLARLGADIAHPDVTREQPGNDRSVSVRQWFATGATVTHYEVSK